MSAIGDAANLLLAGAGFVASCTTAWVTIRRIKPTAEQTHAKVTEVANGQRARIDQLEQTAQAHGVPIPPAPLHAAETGSEPI